jgi:glycosyltransferase involved in cell wall biosynthesis
MVETSPARATRRIEVCIFTETYAPVVGGGETQARLLGEALTASGIPTFVLTRRSDPALPRRELVDGLPVQRLWPTGRGQLKKWGLLLSGVPALIARRRDYDVVFVSGFRIIGMGAVLAAKLLRKKIVLKADSQGEMSGEFFTAGLARFGVRPSTLLFRAFLGVRNAVLRRADAFAAITDDVEAELLSAGVVAERIRRIPNAVDTSRFTPVDDAAKRAARQRLGLATDARIFVYTGRLVSYKGLPVLLRAWSRVHTIEPRAVLMLVGSGGLDIHACEDELRTTVRTEGLESSVVFTGSVQNVQEYLQASDVFVFPTENDAFPSSLIEAMASGLPVIATAVGAIPEVVSHGENGFLVPPGDLDALTAAMERLLADPDLSGGLGRAGRRTVETRYSATGVTARYTHLLRALVEGAECASP